MTVLQSLNFTAHNVAANDGRVMFCLRSVRMGALPQVVRV